MTIQGNWGVIVTVNRHHTPGFLLNDTCPPCTAFGVCIRFSFLCPPRLNSSLFSVISVRKLIDLGLEQQKSRLHISHRGEGHTGSKPGCVFRGQERICSGRVLSARVHFKFRQSHGAMSTLTHRLIELLP